jgi:DNA-binding transcriptional LysR family regulator
MEIRELRSLVLLARFGSIQKVAEQIGLTPAAVHKHLKSLQAEFGMPLYERCGGRLRLTAAGDVVLPYLREVLVQHEAAYAALQDYKAAKRGLVRFGSGPSFSAYLLPGLLKRFHRLFPSIDVFVETGGGQQLIQRLREGALDLAFDLSTGVLQEPDVEVCAMWDAEAAFIGDPRSVPLRCAAKQLEKYPFILFRVGSRMEELVERHLAEINLRPRVIMRSDNAEAVKAMVRSGLGISILFLWTVEADLKNRTLSVIHTGQKRLVSRMSLLKTRARYTPRPVAEFIGVVRSADWPHLHMARGVDQLKVNSK